MGFLIFDFCPFAFKSFGGRKFMAAKKKSLNFFKPARKSLNFFKPARKSLKIFDREIFLAGFFLVSVS
jgi:hypothetical protein